MKNRKIYIVKNGTTFSNTAKYFGDFDTWTAQALGAGQVETCILDVENGALLPSPDKCAGVVLTGAHAMVTDELPWSVSLEKWIPRLLKARIPLIGICYGHQLLARAVGGEVGFHPRGKQIGTVQIELLPDSRDDALFRSLPRTFSAHVTHSQSVLRLPPKARRLAFSTYEPNHGFRLGECAWGVQFHPEYSTDVMRSYIEEQADELGSAGMDIRDLLSKVEKTPFAAQILRNFKRIVEERLASKAESSPYSTS